MVEARESRMELLLRITPRRFPLLRRDISLKQLVQSQWQRRPVIAMVGIGRLGSLRPKQEISECRNVEESCSLNATRRLATFRAKHQNTAYTYVWSTAASYSLTMSNATFTARGIINVTVTYP
jgi:hypothetical protein